MANLTTKYMGLTLRNPIIVGSSGLTDSLDNIKHLYEKGAGAVVLKSLFEEEIQAEMRQAQNQAASPGTIYPEIFDFFDYDEMEDSVSKYLFLIEDAKKAVDIPIIASVNAVSSNEWTSFAKRIEAAGADALELNAFILPSDVNRSSEQNEQIYFDIIEKVKKEVSIPISMKISYYFSNLGQMIQKLSQSGLASLVLFNRFYSPDFDINNFTVNSASVLSNPSDLPISLRWVAIMANRVNCDLAASTGVHDGQAVVKQLLAGANAVQLVSTFYKNGPEYLENVLIDLENWMHDHEYETIDDFRGKLSYEKAANPAALERVQFMRHFSGK